MRRGLKGGIGKDVPGAKDQILQPRQGQEVFYLWDPVIGPFSQPNSTHLRETSYRLGPARLYLLRPRDEKSAHPSPFDQQFPPPSFPPRAPPPPPFPPSLPVPPPTTT